MLSAWMSSPDRRRNILNPDFLDTGIAGKKQAGHIIIVEFFGQEKFLPKPGYSSLEQPVSPAKILPNNINVQANENSPISNLIIPNYHPPENPYCPIWLFSMISTPVASFGGIDSKSDHQSKKILNIVSASYLFPGSILI